MEPRQIQQIMSWCNENGIRIFVKVFGMKYKIVVERNGTQKIGENLYEQKPTIKDLNVWDEIRKLYKGYYDLNFKKLEKKQVTI